jgi:aspartate/glutamate racemase
MKTLGIVGGIAPESTVDYYRQIIALYQRQRSDGGYLLAQDLLNPTVERDARKSAARPSL